MWRGAGYGEDLLVALATHHRVLPHREIYTPQHDNGNIRDSPSGTFCGVSTLPGFPEYPHRVPGIPYPGLPEYPGSVLRADIDSLTTAIAGR